MYNKIADNYKSHLVAIINVTSYYLNKNIVSNVFSTLTQGQSRVSAQDTVISQFNSNGRSTVDTFFAKGIVVEGIWINLL